MKTPGKTETQEDFLDQEMNIDDIRLEKLKVIEKTKFKQLEKIEEELDLPYQLHGIQAKPKKKQPSFYIDQIYARHKLPQHFITNYLYKIYLGVLHSMASLDEEFLNEYLEKGFAEKLIKRLKTLKKKGYEIRISEDVVGKQGETISPKLAIYDQYFIRGLTLDREVNGKEEDYHVYKEPRPFGLIVYTPLKLSNPQNFVDPTENKSIYENTKKAIARKFICIKSPYILKILNPEKEEIKLDDSLNTWEHMVVFESELIAPEFLKSSYRLEDYKEWLTKFKFGRWIISDMDNWMWGNPVLTPKNTFEDDIFKGSDMYVKSGFNFGYNTKKKYENAREQED